jgi:hypothetical protein
LYTDFSTSWTVLDFMEINDDNDDDDDDTVKSTFILNLGALLYYSYM